MKKKLLSLVLSAALLLSSCGTAAQTETAATTTTAAVTTTTTAAETTTTAAETTTTAAETTTTAAETTTTAAETTTTAAETTTTAAETTTTSAEATTTAAETISGEFYEGELTPAVWKVTDPASGNSIYMMGTIHIVPDSEETVPQYVMDIYNSSDGIAVEYDTSKISADLVVQIKYLSYFTLSDGTKITDHLSPEVYDSAKAYLTEIGLYQPAFDAYSAAYWQSLISTGAMTNIPGMRTSGVDVYFISLAKQDGKEVRSIETLETQLNVLTMLSDGFYEWQLKEMLDSLATDEGKKELEEVFRLLYTSWATGDAALFEEAEEEDTEGMPEEFAEEYEAYDYALCEERNIGMAEKAAEYIKNGDNIFYMVGFAHFCGEGSVLDNLEKMGFTVEKVH